MEFNDRYAEYDGVLNGTRLEGKARNVAGQQWTWELERK
jgi:hypothetical protein